MKSCWLLADRLALSKPRSVKDIRLGILLLGFTQLLSSQGFSQTPSATSLCNMPSARGSAMYNQYCGGGGGGGYIAPPPQPSPADIAAEQSTQLNNKAVALEKPGANWPAIVRLLEKALQINPNNGVAAQNLAHARGVVLNGRGLAAEEAGNLSLAASLFEQALQLVPHDYADYKTIAGNLAWVRAGQHVQRDEEEQRQHGEVAAGNMRQATQELADSFKA